MTDDDDKLWSLVAQIWETIDLKTDNGTSRACAIGDVIRVMVNDPLLAPSVIRRVALARPPTTKEWKTFVCCSLAFRLRDRKEVRTPAGYFGSSAKRLVVHKWDLAWELPGAGAHGGRRR